MSAVEPVARRRFRRGRRGRGRGPATMPVVEHLTELRRRVVISIVTFTMLSVLLYVFFEPILSFLLRPLCSIDPEQLGPQGCKLIFNGVMEAFTTRLKVTAMVGIIASSPVWLYQAWAYLIPALTNKERRYAKPFLFSTITLLIMGSAFAYLSMPLGLRFLVSVGGPDMVPFLQAQTYLDFVGLLLIGFGVAFEVPLIIFFLGLVGVVTVDQLRRRRKVAIVATAALAAVVTPSQDPYTMMLLAVPMYLFYEVTILLLSVMLRRKARQEATT
ncbi:MAG: twin-arginine translocase subunit TatC [Actinomycetota bacterium]